VPRADIPVGASTEKDTAAPGTTALSRATVATTVALSPASTATGPDRDRLQPPGGGPADAESVDEECSGEAVGAGEAVPLGAAALAPLAELVESGGSGDGVGAGDAAEAGAEVSAGGTAGGAEADGSGGGGDAEGSGSGAVGDGEASAVGAVVVESLLLGSGAVASAVTAGGAAGAGGDLGSTGGSLDEAERPGARPIIE
jgi:hypothetical protein